MARRFVLAIILILGMGAISACNPSCEFRNGAHGTCIVGNDAVQQ